MIKSIVPSVTTPMLPATCSCMLGLVQRLQYVHHSQATSISYTFLVADYTELQVTLTVWWSARLGSGLLHCTTSHASTGPTQLSITSSTKNQERAWNNLSCEWCRGYKEGREDLIERRWIVDVPTHVIAYWSIIDSHILVWAHSGSINNGREDLSKV